MDNGELDEDVCPICKASLEDAKDTDVSKLSTKKAKKGVVMMLSQDQTNEYTRNVDPRGQMIKQSHRL